MKHISLKLTVEELKLLATLASDQLFRREFIDPRMPGYKVNAEEMELGKALVSRLRVMVAQERRDGMSPEAGVNACRLSSGSKRNGRLPDAL